MSPGSSTESNPAHIGLRENPGKNLNEITFSDRESNTGHLVSQPDALTVTPQSLMLAGSEFQSLGRAIVKEDEYEEVRWDGIVSIVSWRERVFRLWWEERSLPSKETLREHSHSSFRGEGYIQCYVGVRLCYMYSNQELAEIHFMYGKAEGNAALARRLYQERYPQRQCPDRKTFARLHYRLCEYGSTGGDSGVWDRVRRSMRHRCEVCIQAGGGHFEHLL
ncbi:hypothetical protein ANN_07379 [Periplaneta americana]|uniref:DUF4817 domain-containing protein n=1 Tax=Periplaneta americana TaxID=6978 RepID=A0ABQ8SYF7_PERAM|nr:hypothetical protein ANN_07379 [Periplaneta americana]